MAESQRDPKQSVPVREVGTAALAMGGLAAAFGAAVCCALPISLGTVGLGSAWLTDIAWMAAPYQSALLWLALVCVAAGLVLSYRRSATGLRASGIKRATKGGLWVATALIGGAMVLK